MVTSCEKGNNLLSTDEINLADDDAVSEAIFDDIFSTEDIAVQLLDNLPKSDIGSKGDIVVLADSCPMVTVQFLDPGRLITIDYGEGCTGMWDQTRSGKIMITVSGPMKVEGSSRTVTFDNYYFNGIRVEGVRTITNEGLNENENPVFSTTLTGGKLTLPDETVIEREIDRERECIAGYNTPNIWDDECLITGTVSGTTYNGTAYTNTIKSALHRKRVCKFIVSGVIEVARDGVEPFEIDFGDGECDALAVVRRGDEEKEITLRMKHRIFRH